MAKAKKKAVLSLEERLEQALIAEAEQPYPIPENWCWTKIKSISDVVTGGTPSKKNPEYYGGHFPFFKPADLDSGRHTCIASEYLSDKGKNVARLIPANSTAVCCIGTIGKSGFLVIDGTTNQQINSAIPKINSLYLYYFCNTSDFINQLLEKSSSTTISIVNKSKMEECRIPVAPLSEQQRIVDRIESLFAKLDEAKEKVQVALDSFETRKAAILHKAFTGELTAKWREENGVEKDSWATTKWGSIINKIEAGKNFLCEGHPPNNSEFGIVKVSAVTWGEFDQNESKTCSSKEHWNPNVKIHSGDFLFSRANTLQLVGNCVIVKNIDKHLMLSDKILRLCFKKGIQSFYVLYFTRTRQYREQVELLASGNQDGMRNISQKNMALVELPVPSNSEQTEIVRLLDNFFAKEQKAKELCAVLDKIDLIKKSILAHAFRGALGTNDPTEESALELLKSIV